MDLELSIENDELALMNVENSTELDKTNDGNNPVSIISSINLTDQVKRIIDNLITESFRHKEYQSNCFEELIKIWLGENFLAVSLTLDIKKKQTDLTIAKPKYQKLLLNIYLMKKMIFSQNTTLLRKIKILQ